MIKFVVCDDEAFFRRKISKVIDKMFMKNNIEYEIDEFCGYDKKFEEIVKTNMDAKIYILDIEIKNSISGIDIARLIRRNDWNSIIILVTSHTELGYEALKAQIMLLDFISKFDDCDKNLDNILRKAVRQVNEKKLICFKSNSISHRVFINDILYVVKDPIERKCLIKTTYAEIPINKTLTEVIDMLDDRFLLSHRSCIVNTDVISKIDWNNNIIKFNNGDTIDLISRDRRKELKEHVSVG